jgi:peptidoglycan/xylan/chitin deacetylase (PgdA/CDA1 family)
MSLIPQVMPTGNLNLFNKPLNKTIVTEFQTGHGFTQTGLATSSNLNDTNDFVLGSQAISTISDTAGGINRLTNTSMTAFSGINKCIAFFMKLENITHISNTQGVRIYLFSGGGSSNYNYWKFQLGSDSYPNFQEGQWIYLTLNWGDVTGTGGSFDRTNITGVQFNFADDNTGQQVKMHVNGLWTIEDGSNRYPAGVLTLHFDDGWRQQYEVARPILDAAGIVATAYPITNLINTTPYMSLTQLQELRDYNGWEIGAHSYNDVDHATGFAGLTSAQLEQDLMGIKSWAARNGLTGYNNLAYPLGSYNASVIAVARKYFHASRTINGSTNETIPPAHPMRIRSQTAVSELAGGTSPSQVNTMVNKAVTNKQWINLTFHKIIPTATSLTMSGNTATVVFPTPIPWLAAASITLAGFTPSGLNGTYTIATVSGDSKTITINIGSNPGNATIIGTILSTTADCSQAGLQSIVNNAISSGITVQTFGNVLDAFSSNQPAISYPHITGNYTVLPYDSVILADSTSGIITVTLPDATLSTSRIIQVKDWKGQSASHNITVATTNSQTIDGASTVVLKNNYDSYTFISDGGNWSIV